MRHPTFLTLALTVAATGCGSSNSSSGPVELVRIMVQDSQSSGGRGVVTDLLDTAGSTYSTAVACDDAHPCRVVFLISQFEPDFSCTPTGTCNDPLAPGVVALSPPATSTAGVAGGMQVRLVFNKLLSSMITPANVVEVDDSSGNKVDGMVFVDPSGTPDTSSDPIRLPMGPALVFKPTAPFDAAMQYTIRVDASLVTDAAGDPMADQNGTIVTGTYTKTFTTENLTLLPERTLTDITSAGAVSITPNEILQLGFNAPVAAGTTCTDTSGGAAVLIATYADAGASTANCPAADTTLLDLVAVDTSGMPIDWPAGSYTITCDVVPEGGGASTTVAGSFTVAGSAMPNDPQSRTQHVACP